MNTITIQTARKILAAEIELTDEQVSRAIDSANSDAVHWTTEAAADNLPDIETMELDWWVDADIRDAGVTDANMQRLSFAIARALA